MKAKAKQKARRVAAAREAATARQKITSSVTHASPFNSSSGPAFPFHGQLQYALPATIPPQPYAPSFMNMFAIPANRPGNMATNFTPTTLSSTNSTDKEAGEVSENDGSGAQSKARSNSQTPAFLVGNGHNIQEDDLLGPAYLAEMKVKAKEFILAWHKNGFTYSQLVAENLDGVFLKTIYAELGLPSADNNDVTTNLPSRLATNGSGTAEKHQSPQTSVSAVRAPAVNSGPTIQSSDISPASVPEPSSAKSITTGNGSARKAALLEKDGQGVAHDATSPTQTKSQPTRLDYLARLKAAKSKKASPQPDASPTVPSTNPTKFPLESMNGVKSTSKGVQDNTNDGQIRTSPAPNDTGIVTDDQEMTGVATPPVAADPLPATLLETSITTKADPQSELARLRLKALQSARLSLAAKKAARVTPAPEASVNTGQEILKAVPEVESNGLHISDEVPVLDPAQSLAVTQSGDNPATEGTMPLQTTTQPSEISNPIEPTESRHPSRTTSSLQAPIARIPGLFMPVAAEAFTMTDYVSIDTDSNTPPVAAFPSKVPRQITAQNRPRPVAADFDDDSSRPSRKKPFGRPRGSYDNEGIVIEASDSEEEQLGSEDGDDGDIMMKDNQDASAHADAMTNPQLSRPNLVRASTASSQLAENGPSVQSPGKSGGIQSRVELILAMKKRIADLEQKRKAAALKSGTSTPAAATTSNEPVSLTDLIHSEQSRGASQQAQGDPLSTSKSNQPAQTVVSVASAEGADHSADPVAQARTGKPLENGAMVVGGVEATTALPVIGQPIITIPDKDLQVHGTAQSAHDTPLEVLRNASDLAARNDAANGHSIELAVEQNDGVRDSFSMSSPAADPTRCNGESIEEQSMMDIDPIVITSISQPDKASVVQAPIPSTQHQDQASAADSHVTGDTPASRCRLYVGNLPFKTLDSLDVGVRALFKDFSVLAVETPRTPKPRRAGYALVDVAGAENASRAIEALHGSNCLGRDITVRLSRPNAATSKPHAFNTNILDANASTTVSRDQIDLVSAGEDELSSSDEQVESNQHPVSQTIVELSDTSDHDDVNDADNDDDDDDEDEDDYEPPEATELAVNGHLPIEDESEDNDSDYEPPEPVPVSTKSTTFPATQIPIRSTTSSIPAPTCPVPSQADESMDDQPQGGQHIDDQKMSMAPATNAGTINSALPDLGPSYFKAYASPLRLFKSYRYHPSFTANVQGGIQSTTYSHKIDPDTPLCAYETAGGVCNDSTCAALHFKSLTMRDDEILKELGTAIPSTLSETQRRDYIQGLSTAISAMRSSNLSPKAVAEKIFAYRRRFLNDKSMVLNL